MHSVEQRNEQHAVHDIYTSLFFRLQRLKPFTSYQFRIKATNDIGDSEYSQESEAITTLQDGKTPCLPWSDADQTRPPAARLRYPLWILCGNDSVVAGLTCRHIHVSTLDFQSEY